MARVSCDWFTEPLFCVAVHDGPLFCVGESAVHVQGVAGGDVRIEARPGYARAVVNDIEITIEYDKSHPHAVVRRGDCDARLSLDCSEASPFMETRACGLHIEFYIRDVDDED